MVPISFLKTFVCQRMITQVLNLKANRQNSSKMTLSVEGSHELIADVVLELDFAELLVRQGLVVGAQRTRVQRSSEVGSLSRGGSWQAALQHALHSLLVGEGHPLQLGLADSGAQQRGGLVASTNVADHVTHLDTCLRGGHHLLCNGFSDVFGVDEMQLVGAAIVGAHEASVLDHGLEEVDEVVVEVSWADNSEG